MDDDDPRHATYAGFHAHRRGGDQPCEPCMIAQRRYFKRMKLRLARGQRQRVQLGQEAWQVIHDTPRNALSRATGLRDTHLIHLHSVGPTIGVYESTRQKILAQRGRVVTPIGVHRRARALATLGYSAAAMARESGVCIERMRSLIRADKPPQFVRQSVEEGICAMYDRLAMHPAPDSREATRAKRHAERNGWPSPAAWDDIDYDQAPISASWQARKWPHEALAAEWDHLRSAGTSIDEAANRLGVTIDAIQTAMRRRERSAA